MSPEGLQLLWLVDIRLKSVFGICIFVACNNWHTMITNNGKDIYFEKWTLPPSISITEIKLQLRLCNWFFWRRVKPWMNHLPPVWWFNFRFRCFKCQLVCRFGTVERNCLLISCICSYFLYNTQILPVIFPFYFLKLWNMFLYLVLCTTISPRRNRYSFFTNESNCAVPSHFPKQYRLLMNVKSTRHSPKSRDTYNRP